MGGSKQHTIPQFYLRRFLGPGYLFKKWAKQPAWKRSPKGVAVEFDYYGAPTEGKPTLDDVNDKIEDRSARTLQKIVERPEDVDAADLVVIRYFIANLAVRTPAVVNSVKDAVVSLGAQMSAMVDHMKTVLEEQRREGKAISALAAPYIPSSEDDGPSMPADEFIAEVEKVRAMRIATPEAMGTYAAMRDIVEVVGSMRLVVFEAPPESIFITSDNPVVVRRATTGLPGLGRWMATDAFVTVPLSPSHLLFLVRDGVIPPEVDLSGFSVYNASKAMVDAANIDTLRFAHAEVYGSGDSAEARRWMHGSGIWEPRSQPIELLPTWRPRARVRRSRFAPRRKGVQRG